MIVWARIMLASAFKRGAILLGERRTAETFSLVRKSSLQKMQKSDILIVSKIRINILKTVIV